MSGTKIYLLTALFATMNWAKEGRKRKNSLIVLSKQCSNLRKYVRQKKLEN